MEKIDPNNLEDKLYFSREVARLLGVSLRTIYRYIESGKLVPETQTRSGRHLFGRKAILGFLYPGELESGELGVGGGGLKDGERVEGLREGKVEGLKDGEMEGGELRVEDRGGKMDTGYRGQDTRKGQQEKEKAVELPAEKGGRVDTGYKIQDTGESKKKIDLPAGKGEIKFPLEEEEVKRTREGAVTPKHERDILAEFNRK